MTERVSDVLEIVNELDESERLDLIRQLLDNDSLFEDLADAMVIASQQNEPTKDYETFREELRKEGRLV